MNRTLTFALIIILGLISASASLAERYDELGINWLEKVGKPLQVEKIRFLSEKALLLLCQEGVWEVTSQGQVSAFVEFQKNQKGVLSLNGNYCGIVNYDPEKVVEDTKKQKVISFELLSLDKKTIWKKTFVPQNSTQQSLNDFIGISNTGEWVLAYRNLSTEENNVDYVFFDNQGAEFGHCESPQTLGCKFSIDGQTLVINSNVEGLKAFDKNGKLLWQNKESFWFFDLNSDASRVLAAIAQNVKCLENGKVVSEYKLSSGICNEISISKDGKMAAVITKDKVTCFSLPDFKIIYEFSDPELALNFSSLSEPNERGSLVLGATFPQYKRVLLEGSSKKVVISAKRGLVVDNKKSALLEPEQGQEKKKMGMTMIVDESGRRSWMSHFGMGKLGRGLPQVFISPERELMVTKTYENVHIYQLIKKQMEEGKK